MRWTNPDEPELSFSEEAKNWLVVLVAMGLMWFIAGFVLGWWLM